MMVGGHRGASISLGYLQRHSRPEWLVFQMKTSSSYSYTSRSALPLFPLFLLDYRQKTTPEQAKMILNSQPQVSYALMDLMVKINAVNMEVFQVSHPPPFFHQADLSRFP